MKDSVIKSSIWVSSRLVATSSAEAGLSRPLKNALIDRALGAEPNARPGCKEADPGAALIRHASAIADHVARASRPLFGAPREGRLDAHKR